MICEPQINHDILRKPSSIIVLSFTLYITQTTRQNEPFQGSNAHARKKAMRMRDIVFVAN